MNSEIAQMLAVHQSAERFGIALKPEFLSALSQAVPQGAIPLDPPMKSSGPSHHALTKAELTGRGIVQIGYPSTTQTQKDGTHD